MSSDIVPPNQVAPSVLAVFRKATRDFRRALAELFLFDALFRIITLILLTPLVAWMFRRFVSSSGNAAVGNVDIARLLLTPGGIVCSLGLAAMYCAISMGKLAGLLSIGREICSNRRTTCRDTLRCTLARLPRILQACLFLLVVLAFTLLPFLLAAFLTAKWLLTKHDINYYLDAHPPEFIAAIAIGGLLVVLATIVISFVGAPLIFMLPEILFGQSSVRAAFRRSTSLGRQFGFRYIAGTILLWIAATAASSLLLNGVIRFAGSHLIRTAGDSVGILVLILGLLTAVSLIANFVLAFVSDSIGCLVVARIHHQANDQGHLTTQDSEPHIAEAGTTSRWPIANRATLAGALAVLGLTVIVAVRILEDVRWNDQVDISAHRGSSLAAPENTLSAVRQAIANGATYVEFDVQRTADGVIVVNHDADLMRVARSPLVISESQYDELREVDVGSLFGREFAGERIPTLIDVIDAAEGKIKLIVELKSYQADASLLVADVIQILKQRNLSSSAVIMSLEYDEVQAVERLAPEFESGYVASVTLGDLSQLQADFFAISKTNASEAFISSAHAAGKRVFVWTVDHPGEISTMIDRGVDNIITNDPATAVEVLEQRAELSNTERILLRFSSLYLN